MWCEWHPFILSRTWTRRQQVASDHLYGFESRILWSAGAGELEVHCAKLQPRFDPTHAIDVRSYAAEPQRLGLKLGSEVER